MPHGPSNCTDDGRGNDTIEADGQTNVRARTKGVATLWTCGKKRWKSCELSVDHGPKLWALLDSGGLSYG